MQDIPASGIAVQGTQVQLAAQIQRIRRNRCVLHLEMFWIAVEHCSRPHFPESIWGLPPKRQVWQSERLRMTMFDAVALGLAYWQHAVREFHLRRKNHVASRRCV